MKPTFTPKVWIFCFGFLFISCSLWATPPTAGELIAIQKTQTEGYGTLLSQGQMTLKKGSKTLGLRSFELKQKEPHLSLLRILEPADLKGTTLLSKTTPDRPSLQWFYLPSLKQTKRIVGSGQGARFLGSDFTYEDLKPRNWDLFNVETAGEAPCLNETCQVLKATPKNTQDSQYAFLLFKILDPHILEIEFYDLDKKLVKRASFSNYRSLGGKLTRPFYVQMEDLKKGTQTILQFSEIKARIPMADSDFTQQALER